MKRPSPSETDEQQSPRKVWGGRTSADRYGSIRLLAEGETDVNNREIVAELKVNSSQLTKCSKYFEVCVSERWARLNSSAPSTEFDLEMIPGVDVGCYRDCFSRMDCPLRKDFKDVKSSLKLLRVASQIEFDELISSICKYLSTILWSDEDELRIRQCSSSSDFPRRRAQDMVARLGESQTNSQKRISDLIRLATSTALQHNRYPEENFASARSFLEEFLWSIGQSGCSALDSNMVMIVNIEAREMLVDFNDECMRAADNNNREENFNLDVHQVPGFVQKLEAVSWVLKVLVGAKVADEMVDCFLLLEMYPKILAGAADPSNPSSSTCIDAILKFVRLMVDIHREVVTGNVVVGIPARVALLERWNLLELFPGPIWKDVILAWGYAQVAEDVFSTLPFGLQMRLVKRRRFNCEGLINPSALATLLKRKWAAAEEDQDLLEAEEDQASQEDEEESDD